MASTFDSDERSTSQSRPIDLFAIVTPTVPYYITSHETDVIFESITYTALTASRGNFALQPDSSQNELIVYLPISHPFVQRFASGIPELGVTITLRRLQALSGQAAQFWTGYAQSLSVDGHTAMIRVPSITADAFKIQLPTIGAHKTCNHRLFDIGCAPNPGALWPTTGAAGSGGPLAATFQISTTIASVSADGMTITLSSIGGKPDRWAQFGRIVLSNGDARLISAQTGAVLTITKPFYVTTSVVMIEAGCDHSIGACRTLFNNPYNFGGHPKMDVTSDPWTPGGIGISVQV